jgi:hypothetical protein
MRNKIFQLLAISLLPAMLISCYKETNDNIDDQEKYYVDNPDAIAQVKFVHAYTPLTLGGSPALSTTTNGFRITMDGAKINGATNTSSSTNTFMYGGVYPPTTANAFLNPGQRNFRFIMNRITSGAYAPVTGDEVFNSTVNLNPGKKYSMFIADPFAAPAIFLVQDNYEEPPRGQFALRFINLSGDVTARYDVSTRHFGNIYTNVANKEVKEFKYFHLQPTSDTIFLKLAGTNTIVSQVNGFVPGSQRVYTLYARGKTGVTGRLPNLTFYTNR